MNEAKPTSALFLCIVIAILIYVWTWRIAVKVNSLEDSVRQVQEFGPGLYR